MNAAGAGNTVFVALFIAAVLPLLALLFVSMLFAPLFGPWMRGCLSGAPVSVSQLIGMRLRGSPPRLIVDALVTLVHRGFPYDRAMSYSVESTYLAQRGMLQSSEQLADLVEKSLRTDRTN